MPYHGKDHNDYINGAGFCCEGKDKKLQAYGGGIGKGNEEYEKMQYYYHADHLGSSSYITNLDAQIVQHVEYVPFGEVFIEERNQSWNTPYLFNGKELDEETGLYYYGARYYNPRESVWLSTDPLAEMFPNISPYAYALLNPVKLTDPTGMAPESVDGIETKYKNKNTGEVVEVHDGKDVTVEVNDRDFAYAKVYESQLNWHVGGKSFAAMYLDESSDKIIDKYETFYYETRYGDRLTRYQDPNYWLDSGPKFRRSMIIGGSGGLEFIAGSGMKAVKYSPEVLKTLISTEKGAQAANKVSEIGKAMKAGDPYVFAESIKTYTYKGKTYILDGHHRIQAAIKNNLNIEAINYNTHIGVYSNSI